MILTMRSTVETVKLLQRNLPVYFGRLLVDLGRLEVHLQYLHPDLVFALLVLLRLFGGQLGRCRCCDSCGISASVATAATVRRGCRRRTDRGRNR